LIDHPKSLGKNKTKYKIKGTHFFFRQRQVAITWSIIEHEREKGEK
jgi:hypothetical protein